MRTLYDAMVGHIVSSGKRIRSKSGTIQDIGVTKAYLTEEDVRIERELKQLVQQSYPRHEFYAEEENDQALEADDVWVVDPISGTRLFIAGLPHYGIVAAHVHKQEVQFGVVYDPSMDALYTAYKNEGAFLNGQRISIAEPGAGSPKVLFNLALDWKDDAIAREASRRLEGCELYRLLGSHAVNDCLVASGKCNGVVCLAKDSFPYFASSVIIKEAGGVFTNMAGYDNIVSTDRVFIGGDKQTYQTLKLIVDELFKGKPTG
jgi:myo-inositol-1(or 4)-monophosphatase